MEKPVNHNIYLKELETALATTKATLITNEEVTQTIFKTATINEKAAEHLKKEKKKYLDKTTEYFGAVSFVGTQTNEAEAIINKAVSMANIASADESLVAKNIAAAARSIEVAMEAIAILSSDAASINAKAAAEDGKTKISKIAAEANLKGSVAAESAEEATKISLDATIFAAKSNAKFIGSLITDLSKNVAALSTAMNSTIETAKNLMNTAKQDYAQAITDCGNDEAALEKAKIDFDSAAEANNEDTIKLGLEEALRMVKEEKKTDSTKK